MTDISLEGLMAGEQITGMLKDVEGEPEYVKTIRTLIRNVHEAFFGSESKSDDDKKQLLLKLIQGYKPDSLPEDEKAKYTFFDDASQQLVAFNMSLGGKEDAVSKIPASESDDSNAVKDPVSEQSTTGSEQVSSTVQPETQEDTASDVVASSNSGSNEETGVPTNEQNSNLETTDEPIDEDLKHIQNGVQTDLKENNQ